MNERLEIRKFGPIDHLVLDDIKPLTVFVGESGCGKSTIMKVLAIFRWVYKMVNIRSYLKDYSNIQKSPFRFNFPSYLKLDGLESYLNADTFFSYSRGFCSMEYSNRKFRLVNQHIPQRELSLEKISYISEKRNLIPDVFNHILTINKNAFYLNEVWNDYLLASEQIAELDMPFTNVRFLKKKSKQGEKHMIQPIDTNGEYLIDIGEASSGIQSSTPLSLIVEFFSHHYNLVKAMNKSVVSYLSEQDSLMDFDSKMNIGDFPSKRVNLFVEEPELSLFPDNQVGLIDYMVDRCFLSKTGDYDITLMLSTHSPYIVNYLNVLLHRPKTAVHLDKDQLGVYRVYNGTIQNLMLHEDNSDDIAVDTRDLSETMQTIYNEYVELASAKA
ncbi:MAG: AAA family ATPase [Bacteroidales bacterium]|nr:AAA family ATPase [Bacteroidales bacterium]